MLVSKETPDQEEAVLGDEPCWSNPTLLLETRELGEIVYSSADSPEEATARDLAAFDREVAKILGGQ